jgi:hypothetical protein
MFMRRKKFDLYQRRSPPFGRPKLSKPHRNIRTEPSASLRLLESFRDRAVKLLRLRGEGLHPILSKLRLKQQNILGRLCAADLAAERERCLGIFHRDFHGAILHMLKAGICGHRAHPGAHGFSHELHKLLIRGMRLLHVLFGQVTHDLRNFEWVFGHNFLRGTE